LRSKIWPVFQADVTWSPDSFSLRSALVFFPCKATVAGHQRAGLEVAPIAKMTVRLVTKNVAVGVGVALRRLGPQHLPMPIAPLKATSDLMVMSNGTEMVGQYKEEAGCTAKPRGI